MQRKIIKIVLSILFFLDIVFGSEIDLTSEKYILYNLNDNEVLVSQDENTKTSIASLTKIMTVIVSIENIKDYDSKVIITQDMLSGIDWDVSTAGFKLNEELTYNDLLYGTMLPSGADAANALAISIGKTKENFVKLMNDKVKELNLKNTHFANVVGLYDKENYSSAYDMAQILKYSLKNKKFKEVFESKEYTYTNGRKVKSTIQKYNASTGKNISFITGSKTGYIRKSGYCLASTATLNDVNYLLITLNAFSSESSIHIKDHVKAYSYFNDNYGYKNIVDEDDIICTLKTKDSKEKTIDIKANTNIKDYQKNTFDKSKIKYEYVGVDKVSYFTRKGTKLGHVKINYEGEILNEFDLIYNQSLSFSLFSFIWDNIIIIIVVCLVLWVLIKAKKIQKRKRRKKHIRSV